MKKMIFILCDENFTETGYYTCKMFIKVPQFVDVPFLANKEYHVFNN